MSALKVLFVARHFTYFRNFESAISLLAERGHQVHVAAERDEEMGGRALVERLAAASPLVTVGSVPARADERWFSIATVLRRSIDHLRYAAPMYDDAPKIRERAWERTPQLALLLSRIPARGLVERMLDAMDASIPTDDHLDAWIDAQRPDLLLVTPLIELGSPQLDVVKSAHRRAVPVALAVWSWDHLSSKARIRHAPDRILVWNETQRREATSLHGMSDENIVVTGAQCFDPWFDRQPNRSRDAFCRDMGLPVDRPIVLYVCSALFRGSPSEAEFVRSWVERIRASADAGVRDAAILVRPHPQRMYLWDGVPVPDGAAFHGGHPIDEQGRNDYFDALYYASAIVGLNTSALIEGAIVDRPVLTLLLPEFKGSQEGTLHFRYLLDAEHGFLHAARSLDEHVRQLGEVLAGRAAPRNDAFVAHFVRPHGRGRAATPAFVDAVEQAAAIRIQPQRRRRQPWSPMLAAWHATVDRPVVRWLMMEAGHAAEERARGERLEEKQARIRARNDERRSRTAAKEGRYRSKRRKQRVARIKTVVRRVLAVSSRGAGGR